MYSVISHGTIIIPIHMSKLGHKKVKEHCQGYSQVGGRTKLNIQVMWPLSSCSLTIILVHIQLGINSLYLESLCNYKGYQFIN